MKNEEKRYGKLQKQKIMEKGMKVYWNENNYVLDFRKGKPPVFTGAIEKVMKFISRNDSSRKI